jgi:hypothetical protein
MMLLLSLGQPGGLLDGADDVFLKVGSLGFDRFLQFRTIDKVDGRLPVASLGFHPFLEHFHTIGVDPRRPLRPERVD